MYKVCYELVLISNKNAKVIQTVEVKLEWSSFLYNTWLLNIAKCTNTYVRNKINGVKEMCQAVKCRCFYQENHVSANASLLATTSKECFMGMGYGEICYCCK